MKNIGTGMDNYGVMRTSYIMLLDTKNELLCLERVPFHLGNLLLNRANRFDNRGIRDVVSITLRRQITK